MPSAWWGGVHYGGNALASLQGVQTLVMPLVLSFLDIAREGN